MGTAVLALGEILWDLLPDRTILGGAPFNFAYRVHTLGRESLFVSRLGTDEYGDKAFDKVHKLGLNTSLVQRDSEMPTGTVKVTFDAAGQPDYVIIPDVAYDNLQVTPELEAAARSAVCVCYGSLVQRSATTRKTLERVLELAQGLKLYDINLRKLCYSKDTVSSSLKQADVMKLNDEEVAEVQRLLGMGTEPVPDFCRAMCDTWGLKVCLVTFGEKGAYVYGANGESVYEPGYKVELADPLGAGDAFTAGFIHAYLDGKSLTEACALGNAAGACVATQAGATQAMGPDDIISFMKTEHERIYHEDFK